MTFQKPQISLDILKNFISEGDNTLTSANLLKDQGTVGEVNKEQLNELAKTVGFLIAANQEIIMLIEELKKEMGISSVPVGVLSAVEKKMQDLLGGAGEPLPPLDLSLGRGKKGPIGGN